MFQVRKWPTVILHLDGDAFFASVMQAVNPALRGKPVVTGAERGVATSVSYEAKLLRVRRTTPIYQVKKQYPDCIVVESDYHLFSLFSKKIFETVKMFSPAVEEYSVDEAFADLKGLRKPLHMTYREIGQELKKKVEETLGITVSVGISLNKTLSKVASGFRRPSGLTIIDGLSIEKFLSKTAIENVWGIGENTASYLRKRGLKSALDFARQSEQTVKTTLSKPFFEIWRELRGEKVYELDTEPKTTYQSITRSQTFAQPTNNFDRLWSRLLQHVEEAFETARRYNYNVGRLAIFLKTQKFEYHKTEIKLLKKASFPLLIRDELKTGFKKIYKKGPVYRTAGCTISHFTQSQTVQEELFANEKTPDEEKAKKIYPLLEEGKVDFGTKLYR